MTARFEDEQPVVSPERIERLEHERDEALRQLDQLHADRAYLTRQRDDARAHRERLVREAVTLTRQLNQLTRERDELIAAAIDTADRDEYQLVIREMLDWFWEDAHSIDADTKAKVDDWRKRAGLERQS